MARRISGVGVVTVSERRSMRPSGEAIRKQRTCRLRRRDRADEPLLDHRDRERAVAAEDRALCKPACVRRRRAGLVVQEPFVGPERAVEPHGVVEAGDHVLLLLVRDRVREHRRVEQREVGRVGDDALVDERHTLGEVAVRFDPDVLLRLPRRRVEPAGVVDRPRVDRPLADEPLREVRPQALEVRLHALLPRRELVGSRDGRHRQLMVGTALDDLERCRQVEDRAPVLDRYDPPGGEALSVADAVDVVDDRDVRIAGPEEVGMERVHGAVFTDCATGGDERLRRDLPAEHALAVLVRAQAAEEIDLERFELEQRQQLVERVSHVLLLCSVRRWDQPKNTLATSYRLGSTVLGSRTPASIGTRMISEACNATMMPNCPSCTASMASIPKRVARTRSYAVGVPPRSTWPRIVTRVSKPVRRSISGARSLLMPPRRTCPNSSTSADWTAIVPSTGSAPSATTTIEKLAPRR